MRLGGVNGPAGSLREAISTASKDKGWVSRPFFARARVCAA
jgi:hypothetical protein